MPLKLLFRLAGFSALLHAYIGLRLLPALPLGAGGIWAGVALLALSALLLPVPFLMRSSRRDSSADGLAWAGYLAMGLFSSLFVLTALRDLALLLQTVAGWLLPALAPSSGAREASALAVVLASLLVTVAGLYNARRLARVVEVELPIRGLPQALSGFSIVQISDIHVGSTIKNGYIRAIVGRVNGLKPDLIAVTGDLVDGSVERLAPHIAPLGELSARHGVYCVTGNHEYYSGVDAWVAELRRLGLRVLLNESAVVEHGGERLLVGGVTDYSGHHFGEAHRSDPHAALAGAPRDVALKLLLAHQPRSAMAAADAGFDVQLSGHTHGGQFLPWNFFVRFQQPFTAGLNRLRNLLVYTSRGTGYWGPPLRFGAPSEITRLRLIPA